MRKQSEKAPAPFFNIGASSLLVIFLILCLVTFAILTLTSAKSDADFAEKLAHHKTNYYAACNTAESTLDEIDAVLADAWQLYIHRNTLVYRLDKLQKSTGLDLRVFEDAITFKIALMVVKYMNYMETFDY